MYDNICPALQAIGTGTTAVLQLHAAWRLVMRSEGMYVCTSCTSGITETDDPAVYHLCHPGILLNLVMTRGYIVPCCLPVGTGKGRVQNLLAEENVQSADS